jgi:hypothetical protein
VPAAVHLDQCLTLDDFGRLFGVLALGDYGRVLGDKRGRLIGIESAHHYLKSGSRLARPLLKTRGCVEIDHEQSVRCDSNVRQDRDVFDRAAKRRGVRRRNRVDIEFDLSERLDPQGLG